MSVARLAIAAFCALAVQAVACGVCVEDKVAATYDHALVTQALKQGRVVVFAEPRADIDAATLTRKLAAAAARTHGVVASSVRTAQSPLSLSFVLDPRASPPAQALAAIARRANVSGLQLDALRVMQ
ncbi:MAG: hypothetical protein ACM3SO_21525 [Betaproteobacteria bacterium]